jgi:hypothetical protein
VRTTLCAAALIACVVPLTALKIDISLQEIDRALTIARASEPERARFHARYIQNVNSEFIERAEIVSEFRRVVLMAEDQIARGERFFAYSTTGANDALQVFRRRVSVIARVRFHPQNNYVETPPVTMALSGNDRALVGVRREPIYAFGSSEPGVPQFVPILGAVVEGSFDADALGQATRDFVILLKGRELARVTFDLRDLE